MSPVNKERKEDVEIAVIPGDGIGPSVIDASLRVLEPFDLPLHFQRLDAGDVCLKESGVALPRTTLNKAREADAVLFGAAGETAADVILTLRDELDTFANLRPVPVVWNSKLLLEQDHLNLTVIRENTEGLYVREEEKPSDGSVEATRRITEQACLRIAKFAFEYAVESGHSTVTAIHKQNVLRESDGLFLECARRVARKFPEIELYDMLVDAAAMKLVESPSSFNVLLTPNLYGDILSDVVAGVVGGLGLCPSANIGDTHAIFEPVHGSAPDLAGTGDANPIAAILSAGLMVKWLGYEDVYQNILKSIRKVLEERKITPDLGGTATTDEMTEAVVQNVIA